MCLFKFAFRVRSKSRIRTHAHSLSNTWPSCALFASPIFKLFLWGSPIKQICIECHSSQKWSLPAAIIPAEFFSPVFDGVRGIGVVDGGPLRSPQESGFRRVDHLGVYQVSSLRAVGSFLSVIFFIPLVILCQPDLLSYLKLGQINQGVIFHLGSPSNGFLCLKFRKNEWVDDPPINLLLESWSRHQTEPI